MGKRIKSVPRRNESFKFNVGHGKKKNDNAIRPKISSNRMTVLPGFLSQGVKSIAIKKLEAEENTTNENILKEDLHSLFINNQESSSLRRSARISNKSNINYAETTPKKQKYPKRRKLTSPKSPDYQSPTKNTEAPNYFPILEKNDGTTKNDRLINCRSLFKKIISSQSLSSSISFFKSFFSNKSHSAGKDFNRNVLDKVKINFKVNIVENLREKIFEEIEKVNEILLGKVDAPIMGSYMNLTQGNMDDMEHQVPEYLFPSNNWQFATPPSQKLNITFYEESAIQPAILCNDGTARIYQLKREIDTNLINHIDPNNIEVDSRYMEQIAEFDKENKPLRNFSYSKKKSGDRKKEEFDFKPKFINRYLREHLASTQMRPKKTVKRLRFAESFTRNQMTLMEAGVSKPSTSNFYDPLAMETSELDFTFVNCLKECGTSESPKSHSRIAPRVDIFNCLDNTQDIFKSIENID